MQKLADSKEQYHRQTACKVASRLILGDEAEVSLKLVKKCGDRTHTHLPDEDFQAIVQLVPYHKNVVESLRDYVAKQGCIAVSVSGPSAYSEDGLFEGTQVLMRVVSQRNPGSIQEMKLVYLGVGDGEGGIRWCGFYDLASRAGSIADYLRGREWGSNEPGWRDGQRLYDDITEELRDLISRS